MRRLLFFVCGMFFSVAVLAQGRTLVPALDVEQDVATTSGKPLKLEQIKQAIIAAARTNNWTVTQAASGDKINATLVVRDKHTVTVSIPYDSQKYKIAYVSSINMNERKEDGKILIHPFYNRWVNTLAKSIRAELGKY